MKFLLFPIGLACCIVGLFLRKDAKRIIASNIWLTVGASLIIVNLSYLWLGNFRTILVIALVVNTIYLKGEKYFNSKKLEDDNLKWVGSSIAIIAVILYFSFAGKNLPTVTMDNDAIKMRGQYGRIFKVSDIRSVDTVSVYPRVGLRRGGSAFYSTYFGNFEMENEKMIAKLCLYRDNPPYIKIRMNDNSLFILNFKKPDKTMDFFNQLKNVINSN